MTGLHCIGRIRQEGFPGSVSLEVTYRVTEDDALDIRYRLVPEEDTPVNLTNHAYFNLSGGRDADVLNHELRLMADFYTPAAPDMIPTGEIRKVEGTRPGLYREEKAERGTE